MIFLFYFGGFPCRSETSDDPVMFKTVNVKLLTVQLSYDEDEHLSGQSYKDEAFSGPCFTHSLKTI